MKIFAVHIDSPYFGDHRAYSRVIVAAADHNAAMRLALKTEHPLLTEKGIDVILRARTGGVEDRVRFIYIGEAAVGWGEHVFAYQPRGWPPTEEDAARSQLAMRDEARERATHDRPGSV